MRYGLILIGWLGCCSVSYGAFDSASTKGNCSPIISGEVGGNVTITCENIPEEALRRLNEFLNDQARTIRHLNDSLDEKDEKLHHTELTLQEKMAEAEQWAKSYKELEAHLQAEDDNELSKQALTALQAGDLNKAGELLDKLIAQREQTVDKLASDHSNRAQVFELQFKPVQALQHAEKAYRYRPENTEYAHKYAYLLAKQNQHAQAISIYEQNLQRYRTMEDRANIVTTLNNLGVLYSDTQRFKEGEASYPKILTIKRELSNSQTSLDKDTSKGTYGYISDDKKSTWDGCTPIVSDTEGSVTITCEGLSKGMINTLNELLNQVDEVKDLNNLVLEKLGKLDKIEPQLVDANTKLAKLLADQSGDKTIIQSLNQMIGILNKEKSQLEGDIKALNTGIETVKLRAAEEWAQRFRELQKQLAKLEEQINAMDGEGSLEAKKALSQSAKQAQQQLEDGKLDEAGRLYDELIAKVKEQRNKLKDQLEKQLELMDDLEANATHQRGQVYLLQYQPLQALPFLESAYRLRPENTKYAGAYALLLAKQNQHAQAITIYEQNLQWYRDKGDKDYMARTLNNLGILYKDTQRMKEGEASFQEALTIRRDLAKTNPQAYLSDVAETLNNLGNLYGDTQQFREREASYQEALTIRRDLAKANPQAYLSYVADTLNNLGNLYDDTQRFKEEEVYYQEALTIRRDLAKANPQAYSKDVADILNNLGVLYKDTQRFKEGEVYYQEALTTYRDLARTNPQAYSKDVAATLNNLGNLYKDTQRMKEGEASYQEALTTYRDLVKANPQAYSKDVAATLNNLGNLYSDTQRFKEGEASYQETLSTYRNLAKANPQAYSKDVAATLNNLGLLYSDTQQMKEAETSYQEALTIRRDLAKANIQVYRKDLADTLGKMAALYFQQDRKTEVHRYSDEATPLFRELWQAHPDLYAKQFWANLTLNALTLPTEDSEVRCALLKEAWQVAPSEEDKKAVLEEDKKQGGHCKLQD